MGLRALIINVDDPAEVLRFYDRIKVDRSSSRSGPFAEVTASGRIALTSGQTRYEFFDATGRADYWYRFSYVNSVSGAASDPSDPVPGGRHPALDILSARELKEYYLFGVDIRADDGTPAPDGLYEFYIRSAVAQAERILDLPLTTRTYSNDAADAPDFPEEAADFVLQDYAPFIQIQLRHFPVEVVHKVSLVLPSNHHIVDYPTDWFTAHSDYYRSGQLHVVPGSGSVAMVQLGLNNAWLPSIYGWTKFLPNAFRINYRAGFGAVGGIPDDIRDMVGMLAAFGPLNVAGDLVLGAGVAQEAISLDAISTSISTTQSATNAGYGARLATYREKLKILTPEIRRAWKGMRYVSV